MNPAKTIARRGAIRGVTLVPSTSIQGIPSARPKRPWAWTVFSFCLAALFPWASHAQSALLNGGNQDGTLAAGATNVYTVAAGAGDRIVLQLAKLTGGAGFTPVLELFAPYGMRLGASSDTLAARVDLQAPVAGTYTVTIRDANRTGAGNYRLRLAQIPGLFTIPAGDEGGPLTNGVTHLGTNDVGDLDLWTISARRGDHIAAQIAKLTGGAGFSPMIELFKPDGTRVGVNANGTAARLNAQADADGIYTVLVSDQNRSGVGSYQLQLAQMPGSAVVPAGDEGGVLPDGVDTDGNIPVGDLDRWTLTANPGDRITVQITKLTGGAGFTPLLELFAPNGERKGVAQNATAATIDVAIELAGTYAVLVSDLLQSGTGTYRLHLTRGTIAPPGPNVLANGTTSLASISAAGETNRWTFPASAGETIVVRMGETTTTAFQPWLRLFGPDGVLVSQSFNAAAAEVSVRATNTGRYLIVAADGSAARNQTGNYRISLAKTGSPLEISPNDEGGPLTNGISYLAGIETGDIDAWTVTASIGETIIVRMGEITSGSTLLPFLRLYGPNGALLDSDFNAAAAEVTARATNSGTFLVVAGDGTGGFTGTGNYRISMAKTGNPLEISPNDEGGPLVNGTTYVASIDPGDIDAWTFTANAGESLVVRAGETTPGSTLLPWLRLYGPNGVLLNNNFNAAAAEVTFRATNSGTFLVVFGDGTGGLTGRGNYRISLAKTGSPLEISPNDEGGALANATTYLGSIDTGDMDAWSFTANAGDSMVVRIGETVPGTLVPWLRLYGPNGVLLDNSFNAAAAEVTFRATNSGVYLVVAADGSGGFTGIGSYRINLVKTGSPVEISPNDEGGPLVNGTTYLGTLDVGDLDAWTFTANAGENLIVRMGETAAPGPLLPWLRLYGPNGLLLDNSFNAAAAEVTFRATNSGVFLVVASDGTGGFTGTGNYRISLAKTGSPLEISANDEGGPLINGTTYLATIDTGDIDAWSFTANIGESMVVRMGETTAGSILLPWLRLYGPNGVLLNSDFNATAAEVTFRATNSGTFMVVAGDGTGGFTGTGGYRISLAKTGSPLSISAGDEGGAMTGAGTYDGSLEPGDIDAWTFTACAGDLLSLTLDELVAGSSLTPWIRLYGRDGVLLKTVFGASTAGFAKYVAPATGVYLVVVGDGAGGLAGNGTYRLTVNGLTDALKLCPPKVSGTNVALGGVGGIAGGSFVILTTTNITTPLSLWSPIRTNQFDQYGAMLITNRYNAAEQQRYFYLQTR